MANIKNHPFWNFPIIGIIVSLVPVLIYEMLYLRTNVWLSNGALRGTMIGLSLILAVSVSKYSYIQLKKGYKNWKYQVALIVFIFGFCTIMDISKFGHAAEQSPIVLELHKVDNVYDKGTDRETVIVFRENGTCRFSIESTSERTSYLETTFTQMDTIYTINAPESTKNVIPHQLKNDDGLYYGQIHLWKGSKGIDVYYKAASGIFNQSV